MTTTTTIKPCPVCGGRGRQDAPELVLLDATCTSCAWHYTNSRSADERHAPTESRREDLEATPYLDDAPDYEALGERAAIDVRRRAAEQGRLPTREDARDAWLELSRQIRREQGKAPGWDAFVAFFVGHTRGRVQLDANERPDARQGAAGSSFGPNVPPLGEHLRERPAR